MNEQSNFDTQVLVNSNVNISDAKLWQFFRLKIGKQMFISKQYTREVLTISNCVGYEENGGEISFGFVERFLKICYLDCCANVCTCEEIPYAIVNTCKLAYPFDVSLDETIDIFVHKEKLPFIGKCETSTECKAVSTAKLLYVCSVVQVKSDTFIVRPVNLLDTE